MVSNKTPEPIAIIGMSCRFPGGASEPSRLWDVLSSGKSAWGEVPEDRFNMKAFHHRGDPHPSTTNTAGGHFLDSDVAAFDCSFFEIKPTEAKALDPQQRLSLELTYEALENAGKTIRQVWGSRTSVYVGQWSSDYSEILARDPEQQELYHTLGIGPAITSNRVSYFFNLRGPSYTVDTGCSASLVALHNAVQSLRSGESTMSVVSGVNVLLDPQRFTYQSKLKMFSPDGRSFSFDERANGYGRGEGCGCVVLKPLSEALKDGDRVRAVIRNSALNQDGRTPAGISVPSGDAQEEVIRAAYAEAGLSLGDTDYVEAHGTGTAVGDPIEAQAIANVLARSRDPSLGPLVIGSVKGNIGHTESAAGIVGLIKSVLMLENQAIPPQVNYQRPNKAIPLNDWNLQIPTNFEKRQLRRISVNSFGYGGTNAHVIVDAMHEQSHMSNGVNNANGGNDVHGINGVNGVNGVNGINGVNSVNDVNGVNGINTTNGINEHHGINGSNGVNGSKASALSVSQSVVDRPRVFIVSGAEEQACHMNAQRLAQYLIKHLSDSAGESAGFMNSLAVTINKRSVHDYSASVIAYDEEDLLSQLEILQDTPVAVRAPPKEKVRVGYVFGGQGAQYHNMGREMVNTWPVFSQSLERANAHLQKMSCKWNIVDELSHAKAEMSRVDEPEYGQLLSTAIQLALVDTLAALGATPTSVVGHSSGEIAAAYAVDALSFEDALTVSYHRGRLTSKLISNGVSGAMLAVGASPEVAQTYIDQVKKAGAVDLKIACYNSPVSVTLSGSEDAIGNVGKLFQEDDVFNRKLKTQGAAYHSEMMHQIEDEYRSAISCIQPRPMAGQMLSSLTGKILPEGFLVGAEYWARNLTSPVLFSPALGAMIQGDQLEGRSNVASIDFILEVGPHAQMQGAVKETMQGLSSAARIRYASCLKRKVSAAETMLRVLADLFVVGVPVDLHKANAGFGEHQPPLLNDLPPYAFNHDQRHWHRGRVSHDFSHRAFLPHELLGNLSADVNPVEPRWRRFLRLKDLPWLKNHVVQGQVVFPAAGYLTMAIEAMRRSTALTAEGNSPPVIGFSLSKCSFSRALVLAEGDTDREICLSLRPEAHSAKGSWQDWKEFRVFSTGPGKGWTEHCRGRIRAVSDGPMLECRMRDAMRVKEQSLATIPHHITPTRFYTTARQVGMEWYAPFDNVVALQARDDISVATNKMPNLQAAGHPFGEKSYLVHPGLLDSTLFHGICASLLVERKCKTPVVPVFVESLVVSTGFEISAGDELRTYALARDEGHSWSAQIESQDRTMMSIHGMRVAKLPGNIEMPVPRQLIHSPEWVDHFPSMTKERIIACCSAVIPDRSARQLNSTITAEVRAHVARALEEIRPDEVAPGYQQPWYRWMQTLMASPFEATEPTFGDRDEKIPESKASFDGVRLMGENLVDLLKGTADPMALLTPNDLLNKLYSEPRNFRCYHQINEYCKILGRHNPSLRMLEVGGGTASATLPLLQAMTHNGQTMVGQYDFTDLSTAFFPAATNTLAEYAHVVNYQALDIEQDPAEQGFESGSYDVIIACNVVHATHSIADTLDNLRKLLRPGGTLILMELTKLEPIYNLIFGSLSGWWAGVDEGRDSSAIMSVDQWNETLAKQGFKSDPILMSDYAEAEGGSISVIFAQTPEAVQTDSNNISLHFISEEPRGLLDGGLGNVAEKLSRGSELSFRAITTGGLEASIPDSENTIVVLDPATCESLSGRMDAEKWMALQQIALTCKAVLLITKGATGDTPAPEGALVFGFARTMRLEQSGTRYITLDLDPSIDTSADERLERTLVRLLSSETFDFERKSADIDCEFTERNGKLFVNRLFHNPEIEQQIVHLTAKSKPEPTIFLDRSRPMKVELGIDGLLETFRWVDDHQQARGLEPDEIRIESRAASINFRDVLIATGELGGSATMMNDCAGIVVEVGKNMRSRYAVGDRVISYYAQSYNNYPIVHGEHAARIPDNVSFTLGASLPIVWATTYHSLVNVAKLQPGESILIHAAAGAVGQAAVILAQHLGAIVYATCGSQEKQAFLQGIGVAPDRIFTSRSTSFGPALRDATGHKGVNVILNSLSGEMFRESLDCLASFGRFIEIGKKDFLDDALMPTKFLLQNITFACVDLTQMIAEDKSLVQRLLQDVIELVASDELKAQVSVLTYELGDIEAAFRLISAGKHIGKVVLTAEPEETVQALPPTPVLPKLSSDATYILVGGFGGLGLRLIQWLGSRGARNIVVLSRSGGKSASAQACITELRSEGVNVLAKACDIASSKALEDVVKNVQTVDGLGPIRGVINAAMALEDALFERMTYKQWITAMGPKVAGSWNLHESLPKNMDFFVSLSSIAGISGHTAQANYTAACTFQDAFAHYRRSQGQSGFAIDVGVVGDAGFVSEAPAVLSVMQRQGFSTIAVAELLATLDIVLTSEDSVCQASIGLVPKAGVNKADWLEQRRLAHLVQDSAFSNGTGRDGGNDSDLTEQVRRTKTAEEAVEAVGRAVLAELSKLTVTPVDRILPHRTLDSYGVDSLVTVEFRNWIVAMLSSDISLLLIREASSIEHLIRTIASRSRLVPAKLQEEVVKLC